MKKYLQLFLQFLFLVLFVALMATGRIHAWMALFLLSVAASLLIGRVYCGWFCPINTVMKPVTWFKNKMQIKGLNIPTVLEKPVFRYLFLTLFFIVFLFTVKTGKAIPVFPALTVLGIILTFLFSEELFHRYLCPFGTILSYSGDGSKHSMAVDSDKCNNCGTCIRVCPAKAVEKNEKHHIMKKDCLVCMKCSKNCKQNAINYK